MASDAPFVPEVGYSYQIVYGEGDPGNETLHVRAVVDDYQVVVARWSARKQRYYYACEWVGRWQMLHDDGCIVRRRRTIVDGE